MTIMQLLVENEQGEEMLLPISGQTIKKKLHEIWAKNTWIYRVS